MNLFLDTSALVKLYHEEAGTDNLTEFLEKHSGDLILTISDLTIIEFHSAILKSVRRMEEQYKNISNVFLGNNCSGFDYASGRFVPEYAGTNYSKKWSRFAKVLIIHLQSQYLLMHKFIYINTYFFSPQFYKLSYY